MAGTGGGGDRLTRIEAALLVAAVPLCRILAAPAFPLQDSAWVACRYARNLAAGLGFAFSPGELWEPALGVDSPAWTALLAALARAGLDPPLAARGAAVLCETAIAALLLAALGGRRLASAAALLAFASLPPLARASLGGTEAPLFALVSLGSIACLLRGRPLAAGMLAGLAPLARPEGLVLLPVVLLLVRPAPRARVAAAAGALAVLLPAGALLLATFGSVVPHSVRAELELHPCADVSEGFSRAGAHLLQSIALWPSLLPLAPLALLGLREALRAPGPARALSVLAFATTGALCAWRPLPSGAIAYLPSLAWTLWLGLGAQRAALWIALRLRWRGPPLFAACAVPALVGLAALGALLSATAIGNEVEERVHAPMQAWAREVARLHPRARVLASDPGAIGWAWSGPVQDSEGATWPLALRWRQPDDAIAEWRPEYLLIVAERARLRHFYEREDLRARYVPVARFSATGETELAPRPEAVPDTWRADYTAWRRADL